MAARLPLLALALFACSVRGDFDDTEFLCEQDTRCPPGLECVDGICVDCPDGDCGEVMALPACGSLDSLQDDFEDGTTATDLWTPWSDEAASIRETSGHLLLEVQGSAQASGAGYTSVNAYEVPGTLTFELVSADVGTASAFFARVFAADDSGELMSVTRSGPVLQVYDKEGLIEHRNWSLLRFWIQLEVDGGTIKASFSQDGATFEPLASAPFSQSEVLVLLGLSSEAGDDRDSSAEVDNIGLPAGAQVGCE